MMAWREEPHPRTNEWPEAELYEFVNAFPSSGSDERAQHGATTFRTLGSQSVSGLTSSASCPSFSGLENASMNGEGTGGNVLIPLPFSSQEPLLHPVAPGDETSFQMEKNYQVLLQYQQEHQPASRRHFPHQQVVGPSFDLYEPHQVPGVRRGIQGSQSYTDLSRMEMEHHNMNTNSKRKIGSERWLKLQRHKSFDSSTSPTNCQSSTIMDCAIDCTPTPDQFLQDPPDSDIGFYIDDHSSYPSNDPNWPFNLDASTPSSLDENHAHLVPQKRHASQQHQQQVAMPSVSHVARADGPFESTEVERMAELDLLLSENEQTNLFDAIRNFESPALTTSIQVPVSPEPSAPQFQQSPSPIRTNEPSNGFLANTKDVATSLPCFPGSTLKSPQNATRPPVCDASLSMSPAGMPPSRCVSMRTRLHQILVHSVQNSDAGSSLSAHERTYLMQSPLFLPPKAPETAGSLWLLLHAAQCDSGCEIAGCSVMRRVLNHCLECDFVVGQCKPICNDAKAMLLHYGSCNSKGSMHGRSCSVCWNLLEIDYSHQLLSNGNKNGPVKSQTPSSTPSSASPRIGTPPLVPLAINPGMKSSPTVSRRASTGTGSGPIKPVPIQPNPLPTASNPMGLMGALPPQFRYSLSLYLEQTSALFRTELKSRIEKRVTAAAGQDLLQHMQKKTRLRSLDDLRSEARAIVLGEMERELHAHVQAVNWATSTPSGTFPEQVPPYLLNFSLANYGAFHAQQTALWADVGKEVSLSAATPILSPPQDA